MTLRTMTPDALERFEAFCTRAKRTTCGGGLTLAEIGDCAALARELDRADPRPERVALLRDRLGLEGSE